MSRRRRQTGARNAKVWLSPALVAAMVLALAIVLVLALVRPNPSRPLRPIILTSSEWIPFAGPDMPGQGPLSQVVTSALRTAGYAPQVEFTSWTSAQDRARSGEALGTFPFVTSSAREADFLVSDELASFNYALFVRSGIDPPNSADDLASLRVGGVSGYEYWAELEEAAGDLIEFPTSGEGLRALAEGDVDVVVEGEVVGLALLRDPGFPYDSGLIEVLHGDEPWMTNERGLHLLMPKSAANEELMKAFNAQLAEFKDSDTYDALMAQLEPHRDLVVLNSEAGSVWLYDSAGQRVSRTPNGTTANVLAWPDTLASEAPAVEYVEVRLTSGPLVGRHLQVELADVEIQG